MGFVEIVLQESLLNACRPILFLSAGSPSMLQKVESLSLAVEELRSCITLQLPNKCIKAISFFLYLLGLARIFRSWRKTLQYASAFPLSLSSYLLMITYISYLRQFTCLSFSCSTCSVRSSSYSESAGGFVRCLWLVDMVWKYFYCLEHGVIYADSMPINYNKLLKLLTLLLQYNLLP